MSLYDYQQDPDIAGWGLVSRCANWDQTQVAIRELLQAQSRGLIGGPTNEMKLRVWKNLVVDEWPWFIQWVPKEEQP